MTVAVAALARTEPLTSSGHGSAPGKVILLGEHAVVYGRPALAAAVGDRVEVEARLTPSTPRPGDEGAAGRLLDQALRRGAELAGLPAHGLHISVTSTLPAGVGLGSSAALSVALMRALHTLAGRHAAPDSICAHAFEIEKIFHGHPSGIDNTIATYGGLLCFRRGAEPRPLHPARPLSLVIAIGRRPRRTAATVARLRRRWEQSPGECEPLFDCIGALAAAAEAALGGGDHGGLGAAMRENHELLRRLEVSTDELDEMVALAMRRGALGSKLTGGGGGGAVISLCGDDGAARRLAADFTAAGTRAFAAAVGDPEGR